MVEHGEEVGKLGQVSGISDMQIAPLYEIVFVAVGEKILIAPVIDLAEHPDWASAMELITAILLISLALTIYLSHRRHQNKSNRRSHK